MSRGIELERELLKRCSKDKLIKLHKERRIESLS